MADTPTKNLQLLKFDAGSRVNTWKPDFDAEILAPLDLFAGERTDISVTTTDVTYTEAQSQTCVVACSGTLTGSRALIMPTLQERWQIVINQCIQTPPNNYALQAKQTAGGTTSDIPYGVALVHWDGTTSAPTVTPFNSSTTAVTTMAAATTMSIGNSMTAFISVSSGGVAIASLGFAPAGVIKVLRFTVALTMTNNTTSLILPVLPASNGTVLSLAAGDIATFVSLGSSNWACTHLMRASGNPVGLNPVVDSLTVDPASGPAAVKIDKVALDSAAVIGQLGGLTRWRMVLGDSSAESTGNAGSNFVLNRHDDAGTLIDAVLSIPRSTGLVTANGGISTTDVDINGSTTTAFSVSTTSGVPISATTTGLGGISLASTDGSVTAGPAITLARLSPTPVAGDNLGIISFSGQDAGLVNRTMGQMYCNAEDVVSGAPNGTLVFNAIGNNVAYQCMTIGADGTRNGFGVGGDYSVIPSAGGTGMSVMDSGRTSIACAAVDAPCLEVKIGSDGALVHWYNGTTLQGSVSVAGSIVTYGTFTGVHWSKMPNGAPSSGLRRGLIMETVDQLVEWTGFQWTAVDGQVNVSDGRPPGFENAQVGDHVRHTEKWQEREVIDHPARKETRKERDGKGKIKEVEVEVEVEAAHQEHRTRTRKREVEAEVVVMPNRTLPCTQLAGPDSERVYGVFSHVENDGLAQGDFNIASLGTFEIVMAPGHSMPKGGDLLCSAGGGFAKVITDESISAMKLRKIHVATVTAAVTVETYPDGSYSVPVTLHCG